MKVEDLIYRLWKTDPDQDVRVLVEHDGNLILYGTDVTETRVIREIEDEDGEKNIRTSDTYCYWDEK